MKFIKKFVFVILFIVVAFSIFAVATRRTYLFKALYYNFARIDDYKHFANNTVNAAKPQPWVTSTNYNKIAYPDSLNKELEKLNTVGLLMIKNDSILFEKYWDGYSDTSHSSSFSMAKSITSLLIGIAIKEGKIKSVNQLVGDFLPEFKDGLKGKMRIVDLLYMNSGTDWDESYINPLSITTEAYYGDDLYKTSVNVKMIHEPGTVHYYKSGDTQLLGLIVEKATGETLSQYASEKIWQIVGAEHPALWSTDREGGNEKAYCCFNSNVRDFARIGKLMLDSGKWNGTRLIDSEYFAQSIKPSMVKDIHGNSCDYYGYQWWIDPERPEIFYARGILGQFIIIIPSKKMIIVRLGKQTSLIRHHTLPTEVSYLIDWGLHT